MIKPCSPRIAVLLWVALLSGLWSGNAPARKYTLTCESQQRHYHRCSAPNDGHVRLLEQLSRSACIQGRSWGYDRRGIWVDHGCRARFQVSDGVGRGPGYAAGKTLRCASDDHRYRHCRADTSRGVTLKQQLSGADCRKGRSWGYDRQGIWVDDGCDAVFRLGAPNGPDYVYRPGQGGGGHGHARRIRCGSEHHRYRHCRARTDRGVRLIRQLSGADCRRGVTWGTDRRGIWVDDGCDAIFQLGGYRGQDAGAWSPSRRIDCSSINQQYRYCRAGRIDRAELIRQNSRWACIKGYSWDYDKRGVWVDHGCRGTFRVFTYDHDDHDYDHDDYDRD